MTQPVDPDEITNRGAETRTSSTTRTSLRGFSLLSPAAHRASHTRRHRLTAPPPATLRAHARQAPSNSAKPLAHTPRSRTAHRHRRATIRQPPPPALLLSVSSTCLPSTSQTPPSVRPQLHRSTPDPSLHQLHPVPGPDPARAPLRWLGGIRARHRPQAPYSSSIG